MIRLTGFEYRFLGGFFACPSGQANTAEATWLRGAFEDWLRRQQLLNGHPLQFHCDGLECLTLGNGQDYHAQVFEPDRTLLRTRRLALPEEDRDAFNKFLFQLEACQHAPCPTVPWPVVVSKLVPNASYREHCAAGVEL